MIWKTVSRVREKLQILERFFSFVNDGYFLQCTVTIEPDFADDQQAIAKTCE